MNTATANPEIDIANGEEPRELLGQSVGFENELIGQSNFPHWPSPRRPLRAWPIFLYRQVPRRLGNLVPNRPPPGRNMPLTGRFRQGAKLGNPAGKRRARSNTQGHFRPVCRRFGVAYPVTRIFAATARKAAINGISTRFYAFIKN